MAPNGSNSIGFNFSKKGTETLCAINPKTGKEISTSGTMLTPNIQKAYETRMEKLISKVKVSQVSKGKLAGNSTQGVPSVLKVSAQDFLKDGDLEKEVFDPSTLLVNTKDSEERLKIAKKLGGNLMAIIHGTENDLNENLQLIKVLQCKVGRLLINGFPTGAEVNHSMVHGGAFPANTDSRMTSVGTAAITRFTRPICFQDFPEFLLLDELKNTNPLKISLIESGKRI